MKRLWIMLAAMAASGFSAGTSCEHLAGLALSNVKITMAQPVVAGGFTPAPNANGKGPDPVFKTLPAFCRVAATLTPTSDSEIKIELWMPAAGWNGRLEAVGNGGWSGNINYGAIGQAVADGYAGASTNTGHDSNNSEYTFGHPEKLIDFAYRAVHEMTVAAKALKPPEVKTIGKQPFTEEELKSIFDACGRLVTRGTYGKENVKRVRAFIYILRYTGLRISDAARLQVSHVTGGKVLLRTEKTGTLVWIPIPEFVVEALEEG